MITSVDNTTVVPETDDGTGTPTGSAPPPSERERPSGDRGVKGALRRAWRHPTWGTAIRLLLAYVVLVEIGVQLVFGRIELGPLDVGLRPSDIPRALFLNGALTGLLYGLLGMGLILIYKANRIINFAQAQLGSVPAVLALLLITRRDVPYVVAVPIMLVTAVVLGALVEVVFIRRFREAPRLILTVATIGISLLLLGLELAVQELITGELAVSSEFSTPFSSFRVLYGPLNFTGDFAIVAFVTVLVVLALGAFFRFTDMGIATRASAENGERAALLGIPVARVSTIVWIIAAVLSALAVFLRAPIVGLSLGSAIGPSVLLYGLAAAVIARMDSLGTCVIAGMGIGIIDQAAIFGTRRSNLAIATMLVVILVALLVQKGRLARAFDSGTGTWEAAREYRGIPNELRGLAQVTTARAILAAIVGFLVFVLPILLPERYAGRFTLVAIVAIVGVSLVILTGWSGQISLGQFAFAGIGAAVAAGLSVRGGDFFVCLLVGGLAGAIAAVLIGLPALRIQGLFLAVTTLSLAFAVEAVVLNPLYFGWLLPEQGQTVERPNLYGRFSTQSDYRYYYVVLVFLALSLLAARSLRRNRSGRVLIGVRDNGKLVQAYGVNLARTRLSAFAISGFIAAVAGGLLAFSSQAVDAGTFAPERSISVFAVTVIGGLTSLPGAMLGAVYVEGVPAALGSSPIVALLTSGVGLLALLLFQPGGLSELIFKARDSFLRRVAAKEGIHVPSLIADSLQETAAADAHVVEGAEHHADVSEAVAAVELVGCPLCGARIPVHEVQLHEHFQVSDDRPLTSAGGLLTASADARGGPATTNGVEQRPASRETRR